MLVEPRKASPCQALLLPPCLSRLSSPSSLNRPMTWAMEHSCNSGGRAGVYELIGTMSNCRTWAPARPNRSVIVQSNPTTWPYLAGALPRQQQLQRRLVHQRGADDGKVEEGQPHKQPARCGGQGRTCWLGLCAAHRCVYGWIN